MVPSSVKRPGSAKKYRKFENEPEGTRDRNGSLTGTAGIVRHREGCPDRANCNCDGNGGKKFPVSSGQGPGKRCEAAKSGEFQDKSKSEISCVLLFPLGISVYEPGLCVT